EREPRRIAAGDGSRALTSGRGERRPAEAGLGEREIDPDAATFGRGLYPHQVRALTAADVENPRGSRGQLPRPCEQHVLVCGDQPVLREPVEPVGIGACEGLLLSREEAALGAPHVLDSQRRSFIFTNPIQDIRTRSQPWERTRTFVTPETRARY